MIAIIDCGSSKVPQIEQFVDDEMDFKTFPVHEFQQDQHPEILGVIISGAPKLITEIDMTPYLKSFAWIKESTVPVLGICFGHQIIGLLHGANGAQMREDRDFQEIEFFNEHPLIDRLPKVLSMSEDHCEAISIPSGFDLLASSDVCVNEAMGHKEKPLYGVQFHPETSGNHGAVLIHNFIKICQRNR
jgi:GMP synthase (glutamine-hydrolysing)